MSKKKIPSTVEFAKKLLKLMKHYSVTSLRGDFYDDERYVRVEKEGSNHSLYAYFNKDYSLDIESTEENLRKEIEAVHDDISDELSSIAEAEELITQLYK